MRFAMVVQVKVMTKFVLNLALLLLLPELTVIAPWRIWDLTSRESLLDYLAERDIKTSATAEKIYSRDANAWHISHEGGELEDPWNQPTKQVWTMTVDPIDAPNEPEFVTLMLLKVRSRLINGEEMSPYQALMYLK